MAYKHIQTFWFPIQAVSKGRPRLGRFGRVFTPEKTRDYEQAIRMAASSQSTLDHLPTGPIGLLIKFDAMSRRGDLDNWHKAVQDALNGIGYVDDRQIDWYMVRRRKSKRNMIEVRIYEELDNGLVGLRTGHKRGKKASVGH